MTDLDDLLADIAALELEDEPDDFPWFDAARWSPAEAAWDDPYEDSLQFEDDGCVMVCDPARPWVVVSYQPPWWARE